MSNSESKTRVVRPGGALSSLLTHPMPSSRKGHRSSVDSLEDTPQRLDHPEHEVKKEKTKTAAIESISLPHGEHGGLLRAAEAVLHPLQENGITSLEEASPSTAPTTPKTPNSTPTWMESYPVFFCEYHAKIWSHPLHRKRD